MKILVTGATGRVGSRLVPRLLQRGYSVGVLVRQPSQAQALKDQGAEMIEGDLLQPDSLSHAVLNRDAVIHLGAFFRGATPEETQAVNVAGTLALARSAVQAGVSRFLFASTNLVYGPGQSRLFQEEDPPNPAAPYPRAKAAAEHALMELHRDHGLGVQILRLAFVYGEGDPHLAEGLQWFRHWNHTQRIHLVHHTDVAQAVILAMEAKNSEGQIYNVADGEPVTAAEIMKIHHEPIDETAKDRPLDWSWLQLVDTTKIRDRFGFSPLYPALRDAVEAGVL
ncbi:NAD(P)-dependent oxidoreductase [Paenibacillus aurantius]|uniref:NAD(P)-dependent oxidoreductase n=1 Tax=Paenibacillus aurantius TaxID=2918900 RepID=A0AA96LET2_9BACL|nr:NAD(P)-dependent oxidoreductase [Paenibacillus aurantius]WNQ10322.1 NAD(P)-dependent oxidoreductase [Paenibacillus aurantius]